MKDKSIKKMYWVVCMTSVLVALIVSISIFGTLNPSDTEYENDNSDLLILIIHQLVFCISFLCSLIWVKQNLLLRLFGLPSVPMFLGIALVFCDYIFREELSRIGLIVLIISLTSLGVLLGNYLRFKNK